MLSGVEITSHHVVIHGFKKLIPLLFLEKFSKHLASGHPEGGMNGQSDLGFHCTGIIRLCSGNEFPIICEITVQQQQKGFLTYLGFPALQNPMVPSVKQSLLDCDIKLLRKKPDGVQRFGCD